MATTNDGSITFATDLDNSNLEKALKEAEQKVEKLKRELDKREGTKTAIEQQLEESNEAIDATINHIQSLKSEIRDMTEGMQGITDSDQWWQQAQKIADAKTRLSELNTTLKQQQTENGKLRDSWKQAGDAVTEYKGKVESAQLTARTLSQQYAQATTSMSSRIREAMSSASERVSSLTSRIGKLATSTLIFSTVSSAFRSLKSSIAEALMQNTAFSASWTALTSSAQGFANGIANFIAPAIISAIKVVTSALMTLAKLSDKVFGTTLQASIAASQKAAEAAWRQTDASKEAAKQAEQNAKQQAKAEEQKAKAQERYARQVEAAEQRRAKAEADAAARQAKAEAAAQERLTKAEEAYEARVAKAQEAAAKKSAKAAEKRAKAAERLERAQKKANQTLLGFDEINKLNEDTTEDAVEALEDEEDAYDALADIEPPDPADYTVEPEDYTIDPSDYDVEEPDWDDYDLDLPELDPFAELKPDWDAFDIGKINEKLQEIMGWIGLALMACGLILIFSGINIPLGFGMFVTGALLVYPSIHENWDALPNELKSRITGALVLVGITLIVLGTILILTYVNLPLGVGMVVAGCAALGYAVVLNWGALSPQMQSVCTTLMAMLGGFLFAFGVLLCLCGVNIPLGIGLIIAGAAAVAGAVALNWDALGGTMQEKIGTIMEIVGGFFMGIGVVLMLTGNVPLGIGFIVAGLATSAIGAAVVNWDTLGPLVESHLTQILLVCMGVLFCIGVILLLVGMIPLGVGFIVASVVAGVTAAVINWDTIVQFVTEHLELVVGAVTAALYAIGVVLILMGHFALGVGFIIAGLALSTITYAVVKWGELDAKTQEELAIIAATVGTFLAILGVILILVGVFPWGIGCLIAGIAIFSVSQYAIDWDAVDKQTKATLGAIATTCGGFLAILGVILLVVGVIPLGIACLVAGIALFSVAAMNTNFNELPDDVRNTLNDILGFVMTALLVIGVILCVCGLVPLGVGCIVAAGIAGVTLIAINWDFIPEKVAEIWDKVKQWWQNGPAKIFTAEWWSELFRSIVNGVIDMVNGALGAISKAIDSMTTALGNLVGATGGHYKAPRVKVSHVSPLAEGAVIPPNREFLALLGDQKRGTNIETPESLMRQVVRDEISGALVDAMLLTQSQGLGMSDGGEARIIIRVGEEDLAEAVARGNASRALRGVTSADMAFV